MRAHSPKVAVAVQSRRRQARTPGPISTRPTCECPHGEPRPLCRVWRLAKDAQTSAETMRVVLLGSDADSRPHDRYGRDPPMAEQ